MRRIPKPTKESMTLNPAHIRFMNKQLNENKRLKRELATLRASLATRLYNLSVVLSHE